jgi:hypothetical protein
MLYEPETSDRCVVPRKSANNAAPAAAEWMEGRHRVKGRPPGTARSGRSTGLACPRRRRGPVAPLHASPKPRTAQRYHPRQEPGAGKPHAGICAGGWPQGHPSAEPYRPGWRVPALPIALPQSLARCRSGDHQALVPERRRSCALHGIGMDVRTCLGQAKGLRSRVRKGGSTGVQPPRLHAGAAGRDRGRVEIDAGWAGRGDGAGGDPARPVGLPQALRRKGSAKIRRGPPYWRGKPPPSRRSPRATACREIAAPSVARH